MVENCCHRANVLHLYVLLICALSRNPKACKSIGLHTRRRLLQHRLVGITRGMLCVHRALVLNDTRNRLIEFKLGSVGVETRCVRRRFMSFVRVVRAVRPGIDEFTPQGVVFIEFPIGLYFRGANERARRCGNFHKTIKIQHLCVQPACFFCEGADRAALFSSRNLESL